MSSSDEIDPVSANDIGELSTAITKSVLPERPPSRRERRTAARPNRAGRPIVAATVVALALLAVLAASLLLRKEVFVGVLAAAILIGILEVSGAMAPRGIRLPLPPLAIIGIGLPVVAYSGGPQALVAMFGLAIPVVAVWRLVEGGPHAARDAMAGVFVATWIPLLGSFLALLAAPTDGAARVLTVVLVTAASDTGGYLVGVLIGRHPMAPRVSPKKSWEGFAGSVVACMAVGVLCVTLLLSGPWWVGLVVGAVGVVAATLGDLTESMVKRNLGVKDMSNLLPGHGGLLDRVDSLLFTAPLIWIVLDRWVEVLA